MKTKSREEFFAELAKLRMDSMSSEEISQLIEEYECDKDNQLANLQMALEGEYGNVTNGFLTDVYELVFGEMYEFKGEVEECFTCPCCNYKTLDELHADGLGTGYDICQFCRWEDDGTSDILRQVSVNRGSIADYRNKMAQNQNFYYRERYKK